MKTQVEIHSSSFVAHLVRVNGNCKPLITWFAVVFMLGTSSFLQLAHVEHLVKAGVVVGNDVKDHVTVIFKGVHMMIDHHCSSGVLHLNLFACFFVNQVNQGLKK